MTGAAGNGYGKGAVSHDPREAAQDRGQCEVDGAESLGSHERDVSIERRIPRGHGATGPAAAISLLGLNVKKPRKQSKAQTVVCLDAQGANKTGAIWAQVDAPGGKASGHLTLQPFNVTLQALASDN